MGMPHAASPLLSLNLSSSEKEAGLLSGFWQLLSPAPGGGSWHLMASVNFPPTEYEKARGCAWGIRSWRRLQNKFLSKLSKPRN
jgi:hypothetical protein